jgi:hypothetical protein
MVRWPRLVTLKFLGLTVNYKMVWNFSKTLTRLLKKRVFKWDDITEEAFKNLKRIVFNPLV